MVNGRGDGDVMYLVAKQNNTNDDEEMYVNVGFNKME